MTRLQFATYLRGMLGRGYSVADEEAGAASDLRLLVARRGKEDLLVIETPDGWVRSLAVTPSMEDRVLVKHLAVCVKRFFAHPEYLPQKTFGWPGTPQSRSQIRLALDPRKWRRTAGRPEEG